MTCATCGVELPSKRGRPRKWCDAHEPTDSRHKRAYYARNRERIRATERARSQRKREAAKTI